MKVVRRREREVQKAEVELELHVMSGHWHHRQLPYFEVGSVGCKALNVDVGSWGTKVIFLFIDPGYLCFGTGALTSSENVLWWIGGVRNARLPS